MRRLSLKSTLFGVDPKKVLKKGLEPLWLAPYEPESYVSTNFTT